MKITIEETWSGRDAVRLKQGNQLFVLYEGTRDECDWYAKMFRIALEKHDEEQAVKRACISVRKNRKKP